MDRLRGHRELIRVADRRRLSADLRRKLMQLVNLRVPVATAINRAFEAGQQTGMELQQQRIRNAIGL